MFKKLTLLTTRVGVSLTVSALIEKELRARGVYTNFTIEDYKSKKELIRDLAVVVGITVATLIVTSALANAAERAVETAFFNNN